MENCMQILESFFFSGDSREVGNLQIGKICNSNSRSNYLYGG